MSNELIDLIETLEKGKAFPVGTIRVWNGQKYMKHSDGWVAVSGNHHGKLMGKFKEEPSHKDFADSHKEESDPEPKEEKEPSKEEPKTEAEEPKKEAEKPHKGDALIEKLKAEGYTFEHEMDGDDHLISVSKDGKFVGGANLRPDGEGGLKTHPYQQTKVDKEHQRKGIASAAYAFAEKKTGLTMKPGDSQTKSGKAIWDNPNRPFGAEPEAPKAEEKKPKSPRAKAKKDQEKLETEGEYANARSSKIGNVGEDVQGSARHKAMLWKDLATAEKDGTADKLIKRDTLMKNEPVDLMSKMNDTNSLAITALYLSVKSFPPAPKAAWLKGKEDAPDSQLIHHKVKDTAEAASRTMSPMTMAMMKQKGTEYHEVQDVTAGELRKQARQEYYEAYQKIKAKAEELASSSLDPAQAVKDMRTFVSGMIKEYRQTDPYSDIANALVPMVNNSLSPYKGVNADMKKIINKTSTDNDADLNDIASSIMEGKSVDAALGQSKSKDKFSAASMYADTATRKGPEIPQKDLESQVEFLTKEGGLRAIQWGNSVTDGEREHHLKHLTGAMQDLMSVLNLPEEMISFNGRLGIAIGARGKGSALAHYEPGTKVINLTRKSGVGSLAHEWGHFFDNIVAKLGGKMDDGSFASQGANGMTGHAISDLMESDAMKEYVNSSKQALRDMPREKRAYFGDPEYWFSDEEIFARTFERYVQWKLRTSGRDNTYLAGLQTERGDGFFWASDAQMEKIAPHMDNVFKTFRESDDLKKALTLIELTSDLKKAAKEPKPDYYAAVVVLDSLGRVLLGKRHEDGFWTSPAGGGHHTETPRGCAVRELFEEAGIVAKPDDLQPINVVETANNKHCHVFMYVVPAGTVTSSRLDPDQEIKKWGWYSIEEIPKDLINDERRHASVRAAYMKFYGIAKGGPGSGIVGHQTFHEQQRNHHYDEGLKIQDALNKIEQKIKDRKKIDPDFKVPEEAQAIINELKNRRDEHSKSFKTHNDKHSLALQKEVDSEARAKMKKSTMSVDAQGSEIETADFSMDSAGADGKWLVRFNRTMYGYNYGEEPRVIELDKGYHISLAKTDDGLYSGVVRQTQEQGEGLEANVFTVQKQTIPTIIQALKAKEYITSSVLVPEPPIMSQAQVPPEQALTDTLTELELNDLRLLRRKLEAVKLILDI